MFSKQAHTQSTHISAYTQLATQVSDRHSEHPHEHRQHQYSYPITLSSWTNWKSTTEITAMHTYVQGESMQKMGSAACSVSSHWISAFLLLTSKLMNCQAATLLFQCSVQTVMHAAVSCFHPQRCIGSGLQGPAHALASRPHHLLMGSTTFNFTNNYIPPHTLALAPIAAPETHTVSNSWFNSSCCTHIFIHTFAHRIERLLPGRHQKGN